MLIQTWKFVSSLVYSEPGLSFSCRQLKSSEIFRSFTEEKSWLRFRELLLHCLHAMLTAKPTMHVVNGCTGASENGEWRGL